MTKEELLALITQAGTQEDEAARRDTLSQLSEEITTLCDDNTRLSSENDKNKKDMEDLRQANLKLFLRVGSKDEPDNPGPTEPTVKRKFEDLFNDKGGLK